jgi:hypothetical protein
VAVVTSPVWKSYTAAAVRASDVPNAVMVCVGYSTLRRPDRLGLLMLLNVSF